MPQALIFVRNDGTFAVGHIAAGQFVETQGGTGFSTNWTHVVPVGDQIIFVRNDGTFAVGHIAAGQFVETQGGTGFSTNWTHVVPVAIQ
jgi:hypothetical protein